MATSAREASGTPKQATVAMTTGVGWGISGLVSLFLLFDGVFRFLEVDQYMEGTVNLGFPGDQARWIGLTLIACTLLYVLPRTALLGAILLTGYLGGAVAAQVRAEEFGPAFFAVAMGIMAWTGLALRDALVGKVLRESLGSR